MKTKILIILSGLSLFPVIVSAHADDACGISANGSAVGNMMGSFGHWGWSGWIFMIFFWILILLGVVVLIKWLVLRAGGGDKKSSASEILNQRYAKGEISREEFETIKKDLF